MNDVAIEPRAFIRLLLLAALIGALSAAVTFGFIALVNGSTSVLWEQAAEMVGLSQPLFTLFICALGGLMVGILVKIFGDHTGIFAEVMQEFGRSGRFHYRHAPGIVITAFVSMTTGGSLDQRPPWPMLVAVWAPIWVTNSKRTNARLVL